MWIRRALPVKDQHSRQLTQVCHQSRHPGFRLAWKRGGSPATALAEFGSPAHLGRMFSVDEATAAAIRQAYEESGELAAVAELRRHFPGVADNENARLCVRTIASWRPLPDLPPKKPRRRGRKSPAP